MNTEEIEAGRILTPFRYGDSWFGADYNVNLYRGCCHGCIYCDSRSSCYNIWDFDRVRVKKNCVEMLDGELSAKRKRGVIAMGAMSDPYNPCERELNVTGRTAEIISRRGFGLVLATKSALVSRDAAVLADITAASGCAVKMTVTAADDSVCRIIEPNVSPSSERFDAVEKLSKSGVFCGILLMPVLYKITDSVRNITEIVRRAADSGAKFVYPSFGVTLRNNQREHFFARLDETFPGLSDDYRELYGDSYVCASPRSGELREAFRAECARLGVLFEMSDIIAAYKPQRRQLSLFD